MAKYIVIPALPFFVIGLVGKMIGRVLGLNNDLNESTIWEDIVVFSFLIFLVFFTGSLLYDIGKWFLNLFA